MTDERVAHVRYRLERAYESIVEAENLVTLGLYSGAVNRLYYAAFYAITALLLADHHQSRKHTGVRSLFMQHYANTGIFGAELSSVFKRLFDSRLKSDYTDLYRPDPEEVQEMLAPTRAIVELAAKLTEEKL